MDKFTVETKKGEKIYKDEDGKEIMTTKETLDWIILVKLEPLRDFIHMAIEHGDYIQKEMFIAQALLERAEEKIYEAAKFIDDNYGTIEIESACYHQGIDPETKLGIVFTPCAEVTQ